ncbi:hypothetical protein [Psychroserpens sp.]
MGKKNRLTTFAEISGIIGLIVAIILGINQWKSSNSKVSIEDAEIIDLVYNYYDASMRKDYNEITSFFDFPVVKFYELDNVYKEDLIKQQLEYYKKWKYQRINIVNNSINIKHRENGTKKVSLKLDYQTKKNKADMYKNYDLDIIMLLSSNNRIKSIYEMQN